MLTALALFDAQRYAQAFDVDNLERDRIADTQARAVGGRQFGLALCGTCRNQSSDLAGLMKQ